MPAKPDDMSFVDLILKKVDELGQDGVATFVEVKQSTVSRWASGSDVPVDDRVGRLALLFGLPEDDVAVLLSRARRSRLTVSQRLSALEEEVRDLARQVREIAEGR